MKLFFQILFVVFMTSCLQQDKVSLAEIHLKNWRELKIVNQSRLDSGRGMLNTEISLYSSSDSLLNLVYADLKKTLPQIEFESVKKGHTGWGMYKRREFERIWSSQDSLIEAQGFVPEIDNMIYYSEQTKIVEKELLVLIEILQKHEQPMAKSQKLEADKK